MVSSIYQRQKLAWNYEDDYPELSELMENQMDFTLPSHYKNKLYEFKMQLLKSDVEEGDE